MRKRNTAAKRNGFRLLVLDDDESIVVATQAYFQASGYTVDTETDPLQAIERVREGNYDIMLLDFLMSPICGDEVVARIREFNKLIYIVMLTGHKDLAPPLKTIRELDIQGYYEKSDKFDQLELLVESCIKSIMQMRTIHKYRDGLNHILAAVPPIYRLKPIDGILEDILAQIISLVGSEDAFIMVDESEYSQHSEEEKRGIFKGIGRYAGEVGVFTGEVDPALMEQMGIARTSKKPSETEGRLIVPLINEKEMVIGVMGVELGAEAVDEETISLFGIYAKQAAASVSNAFLHSLVHIKNEELSQTYEMLRKRYLDTIEALRLVVDAKDEYTRGHSDRVSYYGVAIARAMGLNEKQTENIKVAGLFHDVGKIGTTDDILLKDSKLSEAEYTQIKKHPAMGANILSAVSMFKDIVNIVRWHHERYDGQGYPDGIRGEAIPLEARIISVADAFDAMVSDRHYRSHLTKEEAVEQLERYSGEQFDPRVVAAFVGVLEHYDQMLEDLKWTFSPLVKEERAL